MAYYVLVPAPVDVRAIADDRPTGEQVSFATTARIVTAIAAQRPGVDVLALIDVRRKLTSAEAGEWIELTDQEHKMVEPVFRSPIGMTPQLMFSAESHLRAVVDAPTRMPANGPNASNGHILRLTEK